MFFLRSLATIPCPTILHSQHSSDCLLAQKAQDSVLFQDTCSVILLWKEHFLNIAPFRKLKKKYLSLHSMLTNKIKNRTMLAFFFLGKQSTWNLKLQFLCSANKRLEVNNAATVTENKTYLLEQTRYLLISTNIKALKKKTAKREKAIY